MDTRDDLAVVASKMSTTDEFTRNVAKSNNFESVNASALDTLADLLLHFMESLGRDAKSFAEARRAKEGECGIEDLLAAYKDKYPSFHVDGLAESVLGYISNDGAFASEIKDFPIVEGRTTTKKKKKTANGATKNEKQRTLPENAPFYFPDLPAEFTYNRTAKMSTGVNAIRGPKDKRKKRLEQNQNLQDSLNKLYRPEEEKASWMAKSKRERPSSSAAAAAATKDEGSEKERRRRRKVANLYFDAPVDAIRSACERPRGGRSSS
eukprot:g2502.t1